MSALCLKRVYVFGLKFSASEGKLARFTFSRGWAHLACFLAARISKTLPLLNALAVGVIGLAAMAYVGDGGVENPWWHLTTGCVL